MLDTLFFIIRDGDQESGKAAQAREGAEAPSPLVLTGARPMGADEVHA